MKTEEIFSAMVAELDAWFENHGIEPMCAQEALDNHDFLNEYQRSYLKNYIDRWNDFGL